MTVFRWLLVALSMSCWLAPSARAQDDSGEVIQAEGVSFELNSILVATFNAEQPFLEPEAQRVHGLVQEALADTYLILRMSEVPPFKEYDAEVYLRSCPQGQYIGCVFVIGDRITVDWVIGGRVRAVEAGYQVFLSYIDVSTGSLVLELDVVLDGSNDAEFKRGVLKVVDALMDGDVQSLDVRGDPDAERRARDEEEEAELAAKQFVADSAYEDPYELDRGATGEEARLDLDDEDPGRVTGQDLRDLEDRGGLTPWERAGLTKPQYKLFRNSGQKLRDFKTRLRGRKGEILLRLSMQVGSGPLGQLQDTFYAQDSAADPNNLRSSDILDQYSVQVQTRQLTYGGQFEFGVGLAPWLELGVFGGLRRTSYAYRFYREVEGVESRLNEPESAAVTTWNAGARIGFVPFPAFPVRPTFHIGASYWQGTNLLKVVEVPSYLLASELKPNNVVLGHVQPGAEVSIGKIVVLWTRFDLDIRIVGRTAQEFRRRRDIDGDGRPDNVLTRTPDPTTDNGLHFGGSAGIMFRFRVGNK